MFLGSRQLIRWSLPSIILIASLFMTGSQVFRAQQVDSIGSQPLNERLNIQFNNNIDRVEISGWTVWELQQLQQSVNSNTDWSTLLPIHINLTDYDISELPPILGSYNIADGSEILTFHPDYGWSEGQHYVVTAHLDVIQALTSITSDETTIEASFFIPSAEVPEDHPTITNIYPTSDQLPENLLRFYIEFSQPMQRGDVYDMVTLLDENGDEVEWPFLRIGQEFWDRQMQTLTIIMDPGRIKQGVAPNLEAGAPLASSGSYELVIHSGLTDAYGRELTQTVSKTFTVIAPDHQSPDPEQWIIETPMSSTHDPLVIALDNSIDPILATRLIRVEYANGQVVLGTLTLDNNETRLILTPEVEWESGQYRVAVNRTLEDYAGNRIESLFDMQEGTVAELASDTTSDQVVYLDFEIDSR